MPRGRVARTTRLQLGAKRGRSRDRLAHWSTGGKAARQGGCRCGERQAAATSLPLYSSGRMTSSGRTRPRSLRTSSSPCRDRPSAGRASRAVAQPVALGLEAGELDPALPRGRDDSRPRRARPLGPAMAWPAKVPTMISASAGSAARRIIPKLLAGPSHNGTESEIWQVENRSAISRAISQLFQPPLRPR